MYINKGNSNIESINRSLISTTKEQFKIDSSFYTNTYFYSIFTEILGFELFRLS
jgi:hypothetical protein